MRSLIRPILYATRHTLSRTMSSCAPGSVLTGTRWDYRIIDTVSGDNTHRSRVFKAEVIPRGNALNTPRWALIKGASLDDAKLTDSPVIEGTSVDAATGTGTVVVNAPLGGSPDPMEDLDRECEIYRLPGVASSTCFRTMYDEVDVGANGKCIALEWLDTTLGRLKYDPHMLTYTIIGAILKAALNSCDILERQQYVNTDFKPENILLSGIEKRTGPITAKVGDFGGVFPAGDRFQAQPWAMRAPEVFLGQACTEPSQVWAVAAMLLVWIKPSVLGVGDSPHWLLNKAWAMAKIKRLFPNWNLPTPDEVVENDNFKIAVKVAHRVSQEEPELLAISPLEEELQRVEMPQQLRDLLRLILVVDPSKRPRASSVLASEEFRAFEKFIGI